ncbi:MAG: hypothetical protein LBB73_07760 [Dysgonamonadaceae bacterium]|nr:hypothetical protein [Dysgonamonadaceae bacterium]
METLSSSIVALFLEKGKVIIPEFGYLELKVFPGKCTVLFNETESLPVFVASEDSIESRIYANISVPLKKGQTVVVPEVGVFRPVKNVDGSYRISYTVSSTLRELLNGSVKSKADIGIPLLPAAETQNTNVSAGKREATKPEDERKTEEKGGERRIEKRGATLVRKPDIRSNRLNIRNTSKVGDVVIPQEEKRSDVARMRGIVAVAVAIVLFFIVWLLFPKGNNNNYEDERNDTPEALESIDLPSLAEKKYGTRIFWVYIYIENKDKISSPVNIPLGTDLKIPDLWEDYKVNIMDSMEIKKAIDLANKILK